MSTPSISAIAATLRVQYGITSVRQMEQITTELLVNMPTEGAIGELEFDGDPTGVVVPQFSGQLLHNTSNDTYYRSTGTDASDWVAISGGSSQDMMVDWTPTNAEFWSMFQYLSYNDLPGVTSLTFRGDTYRFGFDLEFCQDLVSVSFPNLTTVSSGLPGIEGYIYIVSGTALTSFSAPLLTFVEDDLTVSTNTLLTSVDLSSLEETGDDLNLAGNTELTSIDLTSLQTVGNRVLFQDCTSLSSVSFPSFLPTNGKNITFSNCSLSQDSVDHILSRCVANAGYVSGTVSLNGGTNSAPSGTGALMVIELQGRGVTVNTN